MPKVPINENLPTHSASMSFGKFMRLSLYGEERSEAVSGFDACLDSENGLKSPAKSSAEMPKDSETSESSVPSRSQGYYASPLRVGKEGDFYTSVSASRFFGGAMAMYILGLLDSGRLTAPLRIVEIGADKGYLLGDVAQFLDALSEGLLCSVEFATLEPLGELAAFQREYFSSLRLSQETKFCVYESVESLCEDAYGQSVVIISNEIFDSAPCEVVRCDLESAPQMLYVAAENTRFVPQWGELSDEVRSLWQRYISLTHGVDSQKRGDQSMIVPRWGELLETIRTISLAHSSHASNAPITSRVYFLSFDYGGFGLEQPLSYNPRFYHAHRVVSLREILEQGEELTALYQKADITYDVDFALLEALLVERGFRRVYAKAQSRVLIEEMRLLELLEMYGEQKGYGSYLSQIQKVKTLLNTMGERFMGVCYEFGGE